MKHGFSILLGEYLNSESINYVDCKEYQIVCPVCYEPIFKVEKNINDKNVHFLSHYSESKSDTTKCELRVKQYTSTDIETMNLEAKGQRLKVYLDVFKQMVTANIYPEIKTETKAAVRAFDKNKSINRVRNIFTTQQLNISSNDFYNTAKGVLNKYEEFNATLKTSFAIDKQISISWDLLKHLYSPKGRKNLTFLFNHAFYQTYIMLHTTSDDVIENFPDEAEHIDQLSAETNKQLILHIQQLMITKPSKAYSYITMMDKTISPKGVSFLNLIVNLVFQNMVDTLLRLPYFEQLKGMDLKNNPTMREISNLN